MDAAPFAAETDLTDRIRMLANLRDSGFPHAGGD